MATITLTDANAATKGSLVGVGVDPMTFYDWDLKAVAGSAAAADVIETPVLDLNAVGPKCNRVVFQKQFASASADTMKLLVSPNGTNWYTAPLYNGGTAGGVAVGNTNIAELALTGLPSMRFIKGQITLAGGIGAQAAARIALSLMRF